MTTIAGEELVPLPARGRIFRASRRVRLADADIGGRCRLDALARYLQDVSNDDTRDAGLLEDVAWVVRRTVVDVAQAPRLGETIELATFCGGIGSRWAERRVSVSGAGGARVEAATLWVHIDMATQAPKKLPAQFHDLFAEAADGRTVSSRLLLGRPPQDLAAGDPWVLRATDFDMLGHVNNAAYWEIVEEQLAALPGLDRPLRALVEFLRPIEPGASVRVHAVDGADALDVWVLGADGVHSAARVVAR